MRCGFYLSTPSDCVSEGMEAPGWNTEEFIQSSTDLPALSPVFLPLPVLALLSLILGEVSQGLLKIR